MSVCTYTTPTRQMALTLHKLQNLLVLILRLLGAEKRNRHEDPAPNMVDIESEWTDLRVSDQVNLVLENDDLFQFHDLNGRQVLRGLRLWTRLITS